MNFGRFSGEPLTRWLQNPAAPDRQMRIEEDFWYVDPQDGQWHAPRGTVVDGASIPRVLWSVVGSPFEGDYRSASIVHDVACVERGRSWRDVHRMFYFACRAGGTAQLRAKLMYGAVAAFGPRWSAPFSAVDGVPDLEREVALPSTESTRAPADREKFVADLEAALRRDGDSMSLDEIDRFAERER